MTTATLAGLVLIGGFVLLLLMRVPISFAMLLSTLGSAMVTGTNFSVLVRQMVDGANNFSLLSIPFFIVMGEFMSAGGISEKIVDLANLAVGRFRGGLAYVNVLDSMFFGGISGSAVADVSSLGTIVIPMMVKQGYDEDFSVGLTVTTACQGVLIPPSHNMVIYALAAGGVSIGTLFMAGLLPGIALGSGMIIMCMLMAKRYNFPKGEGVAKGEGIKILLRGILPMMTLGIIMVGTGAGVFTATEASAIACVYTMFLSMVVFRSVKLRDVGQILKNSLKTLAIVMTLLATAKAFAYMMTELRIPAMITAALLSIEGAELLDCDIRRLDTAYDWGVRLLNPVWNYANRLSGSNAQQPEQGLTAYGRDFLQRMEELSIYVDVSHLSAAGFWDVVRLSRRPVVASHSNSRAVCPHRRNLTDDMFRAIRDSGGVAGLNYYQHFVGDDPTMEGLVRHVEHFLELDGERSLCLGGDMDGCELLAGGMRGLEDVPLLWQALADRGYPQSLLEDLFWNNLRRMV